jgi:hypothetical protein
MRGILVTKKSQTETLFSCYPKQLRNQYKEFSSKILFVGAENIHFLELKRHSKNSESVAEIDKRSSFTNTKELI